MSTETVEHLGRLLRDLSTETLLLHQAVAERLGLGLTDHKCLGLLLEAPRPVTAGRLATLTGLTTGAITGTIDRLEAAGYVHRRRDTRDRRRVLLELDEAKVRREVLPLFAPMAGRMGALAASYARRDLSTIVGFLEQGLEIARRHRERVRAKGARRGEAGIPSAALANPRHATRPRPRTTPTS